MTGKAKAALNEAASAILNLLLNSWRCGRARRLLRRRRWLRLLLAFGFFARREDGVKDSSFHARHKLDNCDVTDVLDEPVDDLVSEIAVGHLASAETEAGFHLVAALQEFDCLIFLGLVIVVIHRDGEFNFLDDDDLLFFARGALGLVLLVEEAAVVLDAADGWDGSGRDFDQVESTFAGNLERFKWGQNAELFAVFIDYADFAGANAIVGADKRLGRAFIECDGTSSRWAGRLDPELLRNSDRTRERTLSIALD
jgi:hypothetical protein